MTGYKRGDRVSDEDMSRFGFDPNDPDLYRRKPTTGDPVFGTGSPDGDAPPAEPVTDEWPTAGEAPNWDHFRVADDEDIPPTVPDSEEDKQRAREEKEREDFEEVVNTRLTELRVKAEAAARFKAEQQAEAVDQNKLREVSGGDFLYGEDDDDDSIWGNNDATGWAEGESLMVFGPPNLGKSTLAHQLVYARLGLIGEVLGMPVRDDGGRIYYVAGDRPRQIKRAMRRTARLHPEWRDVIDERLTVHYGPLPVDITHDKDWLADRCSQGGYTTVVIDSVKDTCPAPSEDGPANGYNLARQEAIARGVQWLELHHNRKGNGDNRKPTKLDDVYGSRWLTAGAGSVICLWGEAGNPEVELTQLKTPSGLILPCKVTIDFKTGGVDITTSGRPTTALQAVQRGPVHGLTAGQVAERLGGAKATEAVRVQLDRHASRGEVRKTKDPLTNLVMYAPLTPPEPDHRETYREDPLYDLNPWTNR